MKDISFLLVVLISTITGLAQTQNDTIQWLAESSFDLQTTNPDLKIEGVPFKRILEDVDVVLAGEATHGTKEFADIKHRLFRHLVEELGFRYFFIEADFAAGLAVDEYIRGEGGDPIQVLKGLRFFHIVNKEGLALIKWMKSYNETKTPVEKIRFFGIDCQYSDAAFAKLKNYFQRVDTLFYQQMGQMSLTNHQPPNYAVWFKKKYYTLTLGIDTVSILKNRLITNAAAYEAASSEMEYKVALRLAEVLLQSSQIAEGSYGYKIREKAMAANVAWVLETIGLSTKKAFLWAHNEHVMHSELTEANTGQTFRSLGKIVKDTLNGRAYSIIIEFNQGSFRANEVKLDTIVNRLWTVNESPRGTFPYLLSRIQKKALFMDFHLIKNEKMDIWLKKNSVKIHDIGALYIPEYRFRPCHLTDKFDGLIFVNETHGITLDFD
jgi:erythromycin esterase